jgi:allantoin racemase
MKPRIAVLGSGTARPELPPHFLERNDAQPWAAPVRLSAFARTPYERLIVDVGYVDAAQQAAPRADAIFINSFADYGIDAMRAVLAIPVVGAGEAALTEAARRAGRFAIVTVWPESMGFLYDERLRALGLAERCVSIVHVSPESELAKLGTDGSVMERMHRQEARVLDELRNACNRVVAADGAECVVLGCTCMAPVGPALAAACAFPVLESSRLGLAASIAAARPRQDLRKPRSDGTQIVTLVDSWAGARATHSIAREPDCPVCDLGDANDLTSGSP